MTLAELETKIESPTVEFVGEDRPEFAARMRENLKHPTTDGQGRWYRLVKMVFEEIPQWQLSQ